MALKTSKTTAKKTTTKTAAPKSTKRKAAEIEDDEDEDEEDDDEAEEEDDDDLLEEPVKKKKKTGTKAAQQEDTGKSGSWFVEGEAGFEKKEQLDQLAEMRRAKAVDRFYLKDTAKEAIDPNTGSKQTEAKIVFLDSKPFSIFEHSLQINGKYGNMYTCTRDFGPCPICDKGERPTFTMYFSIIDTRKFTKKKPDPKTGATISEPHRKLFPAKGVAQDKLKEILAENDNDLRGLVVHVKRYDAKEPNCGRDFKVLGRLTEAKLRAKFPPELLQPIKYREVLAPPTKNELKAAGIHVAVVAGSAEDIDSDSDDDVKGLLDD
jgi:hypothetical protein